MGAAAMMGRRLAKLAPAGKQVTLRFQALQLAWLGRFQHGTADCFRTESAKLVAPRMCDYSHARPLMG